MGRAKELVFNTIIIGVGKFSTQIVSFLLLPLYTSLLTTEEYGIYDLIVTISTLLLPLITLLMEESMFRFLIDCKDDKSKKKVISQSIIYSCFGILLFSIIYVFIAIFFNFKFKWLTYAYILIHVVIALRNALARGLSKIKLFSIANFVTSALTIILNILFIVYLKLGIVGLLYSNIISGIITSVFVFIKLRILNYISFKEFDRILLNEMIKYSIPLVPNSLSWTIINLSDRIVISSYIGTSANGIYSIANKFPTIIDSIYNFFYTSWKESAAKTLKDDDSEQFYNLIYKTLKRFMWAITIGMIACMPFVFNIFVKKEFVDAYIYIPILVLSIYFGNISGYYGGIFSAYKDTKIMGKTTIFSAVLNLVINLICIKFIGIWAAAISTLIANLFVYLYRKIKIKKYVELIEDKNKFILFLVLGLVIFTYYYKNLFLNIISLFITIIYCAVLNKEIILLFYKKIKNRGK